MLAVGIGGEIIFGLAMGMMLQLYGFHRRPMGRADHRPAVGPDAKGKIVSIRNSAARGSLVGDNLYFFHTWRLWLFSSAVNGHHAMLRGVRASFDVLPPLTVRK